MKAQFKGYYTKAFLSDDRIIRDSIEYDYCNSRIELKDNEITCIYSFKGNKLVFAKGFEKLNIKNKEDLNIIEIGRLFTEYYHNFINEYHDLLLLYLFNNNNKLETFSSDCILNLKGYKDPLMFNIKVFETDGKGNLISLQGLFTINPNLKTSDIIQYSLSGEIKPEFLEKINQKLEYKKCISYYNIKIIEKLEKKIALNTIAKQLNISEEKLSVIIGNLFLKFEVKNYQELIKFAKINHLIPCQFDKQ